MRALPYDHRGGHSLTRHIVSFGISSYDQCRLKTLKHASQPIQTKRYYIEMCSCSIWDPLREGACMRGRCRGAGEGLGVLPSQHCLPLPAPSLCRGHFLVGEHITAPSISFYLEFLLAIAAGGGAVFRGALSLVVLSSPMCRLPGLSQVLALP